MHPGSIPGLVFICGLSLLVLCSALKGFGGVLRVSAFLEAPVLAYIKLVTFSSTKADFVSGELKMQGLNYIAANNFSLSGLQIPYFSAILVS